VAALREILASFGIEVDTKELEKGDSLVDDFKGKLLDFGKAVAGAFAVTEIVRFGKELINQADELRETAIALGLPAQQLQALEHAASLAGLEMDELRASIARLNRVAAQSAEGKGQADVFKKLGVELKEADGTLKTSGQLFEEAGAAIAAIENPTERAGLASEIFGKSYAKLLPLFAEGGDGIKKLKAEVDELGFGFDDAFLENSDEINDNLSRVKKGLVGVAVQALGPLLPGIAEFTKESVNVVKGIVGWVRQTRILQAVMIGFTAKGVLALVRAGGALVAKLGGWRVLFARLAAVILRTVLPLLVLEDIIVFLAGGKSALGAGLDAAFGPGTQESVRKLIGELGSFLNLFKTSPDEVRASFADLPKDLERDLGAFGTFLGGWGQEIVEVGLFAVNVLTGGWENFANKMIAVWDGVKLAGKILWTELKFGGLAVAAAISDAWGAVWNGIIDTAVAAITKLAALVGKVPGFSALARGIEGLGKDLGGARTSTTAGAEISALRDEERLRLADEGDRIGARLTAPATASAPVPFSAVPQAGAGVVQNANVQVTINGPADPAAVARAAKRGTTEGLNLRAAQGALVQRGG
jgi:hypothetical protein